MDTEDWISITEAAARLTASGDAVDRSTLSRYLKQHSEALPLRAAGKSNLVEFGALAAHRGENIRLRPSAHEARPPPGRTPTRFAGSQSDGAARKVNADAEIREIELAKLRKQVVPYSEVDRAGRESIALMQSAFEQTLEGEAATLAVRYGWDERIVRLALKGFARKGLDRFNSTMLDRLGALSRVDDTTSE